MHARAAEPGPSRRAVPIALIPSFLEPLPRTMFHQVMCIGIAWHWFSLSVLVFSEGYVLKRARKSRRTRSVIEKAHLTDPAHRDSPAPSCDRPSRNTRAVSEDGRRAWVEAVYVVGEERGQRSRGAGANLIVVVLPCPRLARLLLSLELTRRPAVVGGIRVRRAKENRGLQIGRTRRTRRSIWPPWD